MSYTVLATYKPLLRSRRSDVDVTAIGLAYAMARGIPGCTVKFFEPRPAFIAWAAIASGGRTVYDVGAASGHVSKALSAAGMTMEAIDLRYPDEPDFHVTVADGGVFDYERGSVVMLCRPCHGDFPERVIRRALACDCDVWYVGLAKNRAEDLRGFRFKKVLAKAGEQGEAVYVKEAP